MTKILKQSILATISKNMCQYLNFFDKITKLLISLKDILIQSFSNHRIFDIFKDNKKLLLSLLKEKIIILDDSIINPMQSEKYIEKDYPLYFAPEIWQYNNEKYSSEANFANNKKDKRIKLFFI